MSFLPVCDASHRGIDRRCSDREDESLFMRYKLLGIDLDGTLLSPDGTITSDTRKAVAAAQAAGITVVPCTARTWQESRVLFDLP